MEYSEEKHICDYCGEEAHYHFKNGKWCCSKSTSSCKAMKEKFSNLATKQWSRLKKDYGIKYKKDIPKEAQIKNNNLNEQGICFYCGQKAEYKLKCGKWCCQKRPNMCPAIRAKNSQSNKNRIKEGKSHSAWNKGLPAWNKGLTKQTDQRIKQRGITLKKRYKNKEIISPNLGKKLWSEEDKKRISQHRKQYLNQHPEKVPYLLNHSSKISYPERYFKYVFNKENINLNYHLQVGRYQLDFYNEDLKKYIQIDGQSHYTDKKTIKIDEERTQYLKELGWEGIRIRWKEYKRMTLDDRKQTISNIKNFLS